MCVETLILPVAVQLNHYCHGLLEEVTNAKRKAMKSDYSISLAAVTLFTMLAPSVIAGQDGHARHHHYQPIDTPEIPPNLPKRCTTLGPSASIFGP